MMALEGFPVSSLSTRDLISSLHSGVIYYVWMVQDSNLRWCGVPTFPICCLVSCAIVR